ncbi:tRNA (adenosine(37)-N6)-threonylcarbamoyltransferase complex dimerization subunit type 1 TsaB [Lacticaseibacillus brantae]|uniref:Metal-dependent protease-like protein, putative molecular chaperone n=1 Tax=Lacticaseibacillus brantae DSM 23927 TaxID=1423727 RepID=A0A0R2B7R9_9LACO|nr:tRNA (adenosine(37)-N6)-threonylcarbamoyltransferase complex dimerization subunit type 1 TsaB [Lacticaseibacillus brantae]KRM71516.1 metal-dependent protease-like protein, putative molecular chaperone [Lacticaseibacillus brantae DSM 23927]
MNILALETSNQAMSVAVMADLEVLAEMTLNRKRTHSEQLMPTIDTLLQQSGLTVEDLNRIVVADGPGSYTGVRIAVTTGKTLAYTLGIDLVGVSSLAVLAANIRDTSAVIVPVMDARRQNVFAGGYQWQAGQLINVLADQHTSLTQLLTALKLLQQPVIFVGPDAPKFQQDIFATLGNLAHIADPISQLPQASRAGELGMTVQPVSVFDFVPRYLRLTEAETNWLKTHDERGHRPYVEKV